jgi:hypothetical protein
MRTRSSVRTACARTSPKGGSTIISLQQVPKKPVRRSHRSCGQMQFFLKRKPRIGSLWLSRSLAHSEGRRFVNASFV